jgi:nucleoside-diphosphate-sugar epimerase
MKVLVTGGAGYLGSILVPALLDRGFTVTVVDSFMYGQDSLNAVCAHPEFSVVRGDVRSLDIMKPLVKNADVIIPLAALVGAPLCDRDPLAATSTNLKAIVDMLGLLSPSQRVLLPITNSGYGVGEAGKFCTEETPIRPVSLYGRDKVEVERILLERHPSALSFRLATVFGMSPRMRLDLLVNDFTYRAVTDRFIVLFESHFKRNFIHVRDVAHGERVTARAIVMQQKTQRPVQFEITEPTREAVAAWVGRARLRAEDFLFPSRVHSSPHLSTRQYARIVESWVSEIGLDAAAYGTHTMRRTKASLSRISRSTAACASSGAGACRFWSARRW